MNKYTVAILLALFAATGFAQRPERIVSTSPSITEMLYAVGAGDRVAGVTTFCHYPPEVRDKPKIGTYLNPNLETLLALRPDLIVALEEHGELVDQLRRIGLNVVAVQHNDLAGIYASLEAIGRAVGEEAGARRVIAGIRADLEAVQAKARGLERRRTLFLVGRTPGVIQDLVAVGEGPFLTELIALAGGVNLLAEAGTHYPRAPIEEIYARDPQVVIDMGDMSDTDNVPEGHKQKVVALWRTKFPQLAAVRSGRVYAVAEDIFVVPGPRVGEAARALLRMIHPEASE